jgi:site-specific recombinase XerC
LPMLLGGLRAAEVWPLRLADVGMGPRRVRVTGKGARSASSRRIGFFAELAACLREERAARCCAAGVLCGVARPGRRAAAHRGGAAADLPH